MARAQELTATLLPGAAELLRAHAAWLPQRDDLCGAFCGALALAAAGVEQAAGEPIDQDAVALAAGSVVAAEADPGILPLGETGRRDYRLELPHIADGSISGTTAAGVVDALAQLSGGAVRALPLRGPWEEHALALVFDACASLDRPATLIANHATHHLWGSRPSIPQMLAWLQEGRDEGPPPDWDVGHFACIVGRLNGPAASLYLLADTYPALGDRGVHVQPQTRLAAAIERRDMPSGGVIAVVSEEDAAAVLAAAARAGVEQGVWDNGTPAAEEAA